MSFDQDKRESDFLKGQESVRKKLGREKKNEE